MTEEEHAQIRAEIAALWTAVMQLNQNHQNLLANIYRLSSRLLVQEAYSAAEEMDNPRGLH